MPTKPNPKQIAPTANQSAQVLNAIRNDLGGTYADQVPKALIAGENIAGGGVVQKADALQRLRQIGHIITTYQPIRNAFLDALINRIGLVLISSRLYQNPWSVFKKGMLEYGETVEEIFVEITKAHQYSPEIAEQTVFKRELPDVRAVFHTRNYQKFYKVTIQEDELKAAFLSYEGVSDLIGKILDILYTSANYDEFLMMKYLIAINILNGNLATHQVPTVSLETADSVMENIRQLSLNLQYMDTQYNAAGVTTYTDPEYQYIIMSSAFSSALDVGSLARAFNLEYTQFIGHTIGVNNFTFSLAENNRLYDLINPPELLSAIPHNKNIFSDEELQRLSTVGAIVVDINWFMIFDNLERMEAQQNGEGLYWQHWYHVWKTFSTSPYANAVALTSSTPSVTSITLSPSVVPAGSIGTLGGSIQFKATVDGTGLYNNKVTWSIESSTEDMPAATISDDGLATIPAAPVGGWSTGSTYTVTARSTSSAQSASAVITLA